MFWEFPLKIQACNTDTNDWFTKEFSNKTELLNYVQSNFKIPGEYGLRNTYKWKETGNHYTQTVTKPNFEGGRYHNFTVDSVKYKQWKEVEKDRIKNGVIYDGIYLPPFYYWYLNFCPIYDDLLKKKRFADVWDSDLWYMQYVMMAILSGSHAGGVKGRQKGYSYKHMAIEYWSYCWFENSVNTIGAFDEKLVKKSWRFLEGYRAHINANTPWMRGPTIPKSLEWHETQMDETGKPQGNQAKLVGVTFKQKADNDVGGSQTFFNYEEPGVSPTLLETIEFVRPALEKGSETTGTIIACGSVGELDDAAGLKEIFYKPRSYNFLPVKNIWDTITPTKECCIFVSEAYNMIGSDNVTGEPFMDKDGNSDVKLALDWIKRKNAEEKKSSKKSHLKQIALSQKCTSPEQAFAQRKNSRFPLDRLSMRKEYIRENPHIKGKRVDLFEGEKGVKWKFSDKKEVLYPVDPEWEAEDKQGVVIIHKFPEENPKPFTYFGGVDNIEVDETTTSESLFSIYIVEGTTEVYYLDSKGKDKIKIEGDKIVASFTGRRGIDGSNQTGELLIRMYNAFTLAERNKPNFITHMKKKGYEHLLARESQVPIYKDLEVDFDKNDAIGIHMDSTGKKQKICDDYLIQFLNTEVDVRYKIDTEGKDTGEIEKTYYTIDNINDDLLLEELMHENDNTDRRDALRLAITLKTLWQASRVKSRRDERIPNTQQKKEKTKRPLSLLPTMGRTSKLRRKISLI